MKLIIDIPEEEYKRIKEWEDNITGYQTTLTLYRAIRNGTLYETTEENSVVKENLTSGDLISRRALLDFLHYAREELFKEEQKGKMTSDEFNQADGDLVNFIHFVKYAPTVKAFTKDDMSGAYNEGYSCGSREALHGREVERPKGEWLFHRCNKCGKGYDKNINLDNYHFCPNCGAKMKGGVERAKREAEEEARREAMMLDDNEGTLKWKGWH